MPAAKTQSKKSVKKSGGRKSAASAESKKRRRKPDNSKFNIYIYKVLKQVHPDKGISSKSMMIVNNCMHDLMGTVATEAINVMRYNSKATLSAKEIQTAIRLSFPGEIAKHAVSEMTKAVSKYDAKKKAADAGSGMMGSKTEGAGLQFPVGRVRSMLKAKGVKAVSPKSAVALAAALEYIAAEILELAGNACKDCKRMRISPRHIMLAVRNDDELDKLITADIAAAGVTSKIHGSLLPKKK